jgi:LPXTG-site transpeptidase (sortase) family protein
MSTKNISKQTLLVIFILAGFTISPAPFLHLIPKSLASPSSVQINFGIPVKIKISRINVDTEIISVGININGEMEAPKGPAETAWYNLGQRPGEKGSAVINGHFGWLNGIPAVFDNLNKLKKGDKIYIQDENGAVVIFIVQESRIYDENENTKKVFYSNDSKSHLNLITCGGVWNEISQSYSGRLVVFSDKED